MEVANFDKPKKIITILNCFVFKKTVPYGAFSKINQFALVILKMWVMGKNYRVLFKFRVGAGMGRMCYTGTHQLMSAFKVFLSLFLN